MSKVPAFHPWALGIPCSIFNIPSSGPFPPCGAAFRGGQECPRSPPSPGLYCTTEIGHDAERSHGVWSLRFTSLAVCSIGLKPLATTSVASVPSVRNPVREPPPDWPHPKATAPAQRRPTHEGEDALMRARAPTLPSSVVRRPSSVVRRPSSPAPVPAPTCRSPALPRCFQPQ